MPKRTTKYKYANLSAEDEDMKVYVSVSVTDKSGLRQKFEVQEVMDHVLDGLMNSLRGAPYLNVPLHRVKVRGGR